MIKDLIMPYFVVAGKKQRQKIDSMPGIYRLSVDNLLIELAELTGLGIDKILLFGLPKKKDEIGSEAYSANGVVQEAIRAVKKKFPKLTVMTDVCLCAYTTHGHCRVPNTLEALVKIAKSHADAGADYVAPSAMMKGQVKAIRRALGSKVKILAYSAKFASNFYGPFREAAKSAPQFGDRSKYQLNYRETEKALERITVEIEEGADIVMVKPALAYLDVIFQAKQKFDRPLAAFNVSGEYAMLYGKKELILESLAAIKRAGADLIITYFAKEVGQWTKDLKKQKSI